MAGFENEFTYRHYVESGKEAEFDKNFEDAVNYVKQNILGKRIPMYIGGK